MYLPCLTSVLPGDTSDSLNSSKFMLLHISHVGMSSFSKLV